MTSLRMTVPIFSASENRPRKYRISAICREACRGCQKRCFRLRVGRQPKNCVKVGKARP